jgi:hypothetical protein
MFGKEAKLQASSDAKVQLSRLNNSHGGGDKTCLQGDSLLHDYCIIACLAGAPGITL